MRLVEGEAGGVYVLPSRADKRRRSNRHTRRVGGCANQRTREVTVAKGRCGRRPADGPTPAAARRGRGAQSAGSTRRVEETVDPQLSLRVAAREVAIDVLQRGGSDRHATRLPASRPLPSGGCAAVLRCHTRSHTIPQAGARSQPRAGRRGSCRHVGAAAGSGPCAPNVAARLEASHEDSVVTREPFATTAARAARRCALSTYRRPRRAALRSEAARRARRVRSRSAAAEAGAAFAAADAAASLLMRVAVGALAAAAASAHTGADSPSVWDGPPPRSRRCDPDDS
eukprot:355903-Chlamydomonas_euryale.AAC.18